MLTFNQAALAIGSSTWALYRIKPKDKRKVKPNPVKGHIVLVAVVIDSFTLATWTASFVLLLVFLPSEFRRPVSHLNLPSVAVSVGFEGLAIFLWVFSVAISTKTATGLISPPAEDIVLVTLASQ